MVRLYPDLYFFQPTEDKSCCYLFQAFGIVSLQGVKCGATIVCSGGIFNNPDGKAFWCPQMRVKGHVLLRNWRTRPFEACGLVMFYGAEVGGHFSCSGGRFINPKGRALDCQTAKIAGCVFLRRDYTLPLTDPAFEADGEVNFTGAFIGSQFACQGGSFRNANPDPFNQKYAGTALNLQAATIKDMLILGAEPETKQEPAKVEGCIDLIAASVRVLVDDKFVGEAEQGLRLVVKGKDGKPLACHLCLDNFTYERLAGDAACKPNMRKAWLERQPAEHLKDKFRPQPFEQLVKVLRAMGHNSDADEIALFKRWHAWKANPGMRGIWSLGGLGTGALYGSF
jgi:hypothetical protein